MKQEYWDKFWETGNVKDYLSYRVEPNKETCGWKTETSVGVSNCESDCIDRNGAVYSARRGI